MRIILIVGFVIAGVPSEGFGQSDLKKIGNFLQGIQQMQQQQNQNNNRPPNSNQQQNPVQGYRVDPNSSGNQNTGGFRPADNFFGPQNGRRPGQVISPQNNNRYPNNTFPQGTYPQGTYPQTTYPQNTYPNGTYPSQGQTVYRPGGSVPGNGRIIYSDPPTAPQRTYSKLPIVVRCAPDATGICNYELLSGSGSAFPYTIKAGQTQNLSETTDWSIRYRPTTGAPYQTYRLRGGKTYEMRKNGGSWQFYMAR